MFKFMRDQGCVRLRWSKMDGEGRGLRENTGSSETYKMCIYEHVSM